MAETTNSDETTFEAKRKSDPRCEAKDEFPNKIQKLEAMDTDSFHSVKSCENGDHNQNANHIDNNSSLGKVKDSESGVIVGTEEEEEEEDDEDDEDDEEEEEEEDDSEDGEKSSEIAAKDRKGKGIMKDDKGKGKLIEEDDDSDNSDDGDGSDFDSDESDLSDDPLAEVDLDNILPSRTRRRTVQPGVYIAKDVGNVVDDDSNDSDA